MNNRIFKLLSLSIITLLLVTGCNSNEGKVTKIKKKVEINVDSEKIKQENILNYYEIYYTSYKNNSIASKMHKELVKQLYEEHDNIKELSKDDDSIEVIITEEPTEGSLHSKTTYQYILMLRKGNEDIEISEFSYNQDKTYMQEVAKEFRKYVEKYSTLKDVYTEYCNDYNLVVAEGNDVIVDESVGQMYVSHASNEYTVVQYDEKGTVENIVLENIELSGGLVKTLAVGKTKDGKRVWSMDLGITEKSLKYKDSVVYTKGKHYVYFGYYSIQARDIQTGKLVWNYDSFDASFNKIFETEKNGVYAIEEQESDYDETTYKVLILDYFGDKKDSMEFRKSVYSEDEDRYYYIKNLDSAKLSGDLITIDLFDNQKYTKVVGQLVINTNTNHRSIELNK